MRTLLVTLSCAIFATILAACALLTPTPAADTHDPTKVACAAFGLITWSPGDDTAALSILTAVHDGRRPVTQETVTLLREALGDTDGTIAQIKPHNAVHRALCGASESPVGAAHLQAAQ